VGMTPPITASTGNFPASSRRAEPKAGPTPIAIAGLAAESVSEAYSHDIRRPQGQPEVARAEQAGLPTVLQAQRLFDSLSPG
jgi:hypothetical protein